MSRAYATRPHAERQLRNWIHVRWESEFINPSSLPLLSLYPPFSHFFIPLFSSRRLSHSLFEPPPLQLLFNERADTFSRCTKSIFEKKKEKEMLNVRPSQEIFTASKVGPKMSSMCQLRAKHLQRAQNVMGFTGHNLFDMKWSSADTKWPPLGAK